MIPHMVTTSGVKLAHSARFNSLLRFGSKNQILTKKRRKEASTSFAGVLYVQEGEDYKRSLTVYAKNAPDPRRQGEIASRRASERI